MKKNQNDEQNRSRRTIQFFEVHERRREIFFSKNFSILEDIHWQFHNFRFRVWNFDEVRRLQLFRKEAKTSGEADQHPNSSGSSLQSLRQHLLHPISTSKGLH